MSDNHGNTPAAWTAVIVGLLAFVVGGIGLMIGSMPVFWVGVALAPVALVLGKILSLMGLGAPKRTGQHHAGPSESRSGHH